MKKFLCCVLAATMLLFVTHTSTAVGYELYPEIVAASPIVVVSEPLPKPEPDPDSDNVRIGVTHPSFDDVGQILRYFGTGADFFHLSYDDLGRIDRLSQFYAIFINCGSQGLVNSRVLNSFVYQGGVVYASDHAGGPLSQAFPGIFSYTSQTGSQTVSRAEIVHSTLAAHMGMTSLDVIFDLGGWYAITELNQNATVYIQGNVAGIGLIPLAFSFDYGKGTIFYTSFHNSAQATMDMIDFIEYLVFRIKLIEVDREMAQRAEREGLHYRGQVFGRLLPGTASPQFFYTFDDDEFMLMLDDAMGNFSIILTDPHGNVFETNQQGEIVGMILSPDAAVAPPPADIAFEAIEGGGLRVTGGGGGQWGFAIAADADEQGEVAFAVGIATAPRATLTRANFVWALAQLAEVDLSDYSDVSPSYHDVSSSAYHFKAVEWATNLGIVSGVGEGRFAPSRQLTYEQMFTILHRYVIGSGLELPVVTNQEPSFRDSISPWALEAVVAFYAAGFDFESEFQPNVYVNANNLDPVLNFIEPLLN